MAQINYQEDEGSDVEINGMVDSKKDSSIYLEMTWNDPTPAYGLHYMCVLRGINHQRKAVAFKTVQTTKSPDESYCEMFHFPEKVKHAAEAISEEITNVYQKTKTKTRTIYDKLSDVESNLKSIDQNRDIFLQRSTAAITNFYEKNAELVAQLDSELWATLSWLKIALSKRNPYFKMRDEDVSDIRDDRVYTISSSLTRFNIGRANEACKSLGGYLVEFNDDKEFKFVYDFVNLRGKTNTYFTGGNDIAKEGTFVYFSSGKLVPRLNGWAKKQPDNYGNNEDCMEIKLSLKGLNDSPCDDYGKFICEVKITRTIFQK
ncbi:lectin-galc1 [Plakobranchus ocellatus]|uniref:Lectin-galc1 n=1 Tax=Plakobranchus ocellatus TaxID=259542 RepID=A0AAV4CTE3_9GAST|nr:lectin-galc1 [Plakobranchus ocellatus]